MKKILIIKNINKINKYIYIYRYMYIYIYIYIDIYRYLMFASIVQYATYIILSNNHLHFYYTHIIIMIMRIIIINSWCKR